MRIIADNYGQISAELILLLSTMIIIVIMTAYYTTDILNDISNHTEEVIIKSREKILSRL